jgi:hypothetical protein
LAPIAQRTLEAFEFEALWVQEFADELLVQGLSLQLLRSFRMGGGVSQIPYWLHLLLDA